MRQIGVLTLAFVMIAGARAADQVPTPGLEKMPFPTTEWRERAASDPLRVKIEGLTASAFEGARPAALAHTKAVLVVVHGRIVAERYADGITRETRMQSWSMAKSLLHAVLGLAVADGTLDPDAPAPVPEWRGPNDPRRAITMRQLMQMTSGLAFREDYGDTNAEVMQMLFGAGRGDVGKAAASARYLDTPGVHWSYSSGSANILSRILRDALGSREAYRAVLHERLFKPLGMRSAVAEFDAAGTWIASSYLHATARDFAKFGELYLRQGFWDGRQLIPSEWAKSACEPTKASRGHYGMLFWLNARDGDTGPRAVSDSLPGDMCFARGFGGQLIAISPSHDTVIVILNAAYTNETTPILHLMADVFDATN